MYVYANRSICYPHPLRCVFSFSFVWGVNAALLTSREAEINKWQLTHQWDPFHKSAYKQYQWLWPVFISCLSCQFDPLEDLTISTSLPLMHADGSTSTTICVVSGTFSCRWLTPHHRTKLSVRPPVLFLLSALYTSNKSCVIWEFLQVTELRQHGTLWGPRCCSLRA